MRKAAALAAIALLAACGQSSTEASLGTPTLTIGGQAIQVPQLAAVVLPSKACPNPLGGIPPTINEGALFVAFSNHPDLLGRLTDPCTVYQNDALAFAGTIKIDALGGSADVGPGTYAWSTNPPAITTGIVGQADASCKPIAGVPQPSGGRVVVKAVGASSVTGSVDLTLQNGGSLRGDFDAPVVTPPASLDICSLASGQVLPSCTGTPACKP
jgi:hypothetical protein